MSKSDVTKLPAITISFWIIKICATTLGETGGDLLAQTMNLGYVVSSLIFFSFFLLAFSVQLLSKKYNPILYWLVIVSTSTTGTTISDYMDRTLGLGYANGSLLLVTLLIAILTIWKSTEKTLSVSSITSVRAESFYWISILISNTLGTALGDFLADSSGLGFLGSAVLIGALLLLITLLHFFTQVSKVALFWFAFVLTRPFGATFGDFLTKPQDKHGLGIGTVIPSLFFCLVMILLIFYEFKALKNKNKAES